MLAHVRHPLPIRTRTGKGGAERLQYQTLRTPVEIPEVSVAEMDEAILTFEADPLRHRTLRIHDDRIWEVVTAQSLGFPGDMPRQPATPRQLVEAMNGDAYDPYGPFVAMSPFASPHLHEGVRGQDLPSSVLARAEDHSTLARQALIDHIARTLVTDGTRVFIARGAPAVMTMDVNKPFELVPWSRPTLRNGVPFEVSRIHALPAFVERARVDPGIVAAGEGLAWTFGDLPRTDEDLRVFVNGAPEQLMRLAASAAYKEPKLSARTNPARSPARVNAMGLAPWADLGSIGAIPPERHAEVVGLVSDAFARLRETLDGSTEPTLARQISAYADLVALPALRPVTPEEDVEAVAGMRA